MGKANIGLQKVRCTPETKFGEPFFPILHQKYDKIQYFEKVNTCVYF